MLEQFGVSFALVVVDLECLDDEVVGVVALAGHFFLEHLYHVFIGARSRDLFQHIEGSTKVVLVQLAILVDVNQLETVLLLAHPSSTVKPDVS